MLTYVLQIVIIHESGQDTFGQYSLLHGRVVTASALIATPALAGLYEGKIVKMGRFPLWHIFGLVGVLGFLIRNDILILAVTVYTIIKYCSTEVKLTGKTLIGEQIEWLWRPILLISIVYLYIQDTSIHLLYMISTLLLFMLTMMIFLFVPRSRLFNPSPFSLNYSFSPLVFNSFPVVEAFIIHGIIYTRIGAYEYGEFALIIQVVLAMQIYALSTESKFRYNLLENKYNSLLRPYIIKNFVYSLIILLLIIVINEIILNSYVNLKSLLIYGFAVLACNLIGPYHLIYQRYARYRILGLTAFIKLVAFYILFKYLGTLDVDIILLIFGIILVCERLSLMLFARFWQV